jgi:hypothetical protein
MRRILWSFIEIYFVKINDNLVDNLSEDYIKRWELTLEIVSGFQTLTSGYSLEGFTNDRTSQLINRCSVRTVDVRQTLVRYEKPQKDKGLYSFGSLHMSLGFTSCLQFELKSDLKYEKILRFNWNKKLNTPGKTCFFSLQRCVIGTIIEFN